MNMDLDPPKRHLYRSRRGMIFGVCRGLAEYLDVSVFWMRVGTVALAIVTAFWTVVVVYLFAALLMKPEPVVPIKSADDLEFYTSFTASRPNAVQRLKRTFDNLDRRIQRIEDIVTSKEYNWKRRLGE